MPNTHFTPRPIPRFAWKCTGSKLLPLVAVLGLLVVAAQPARAQWGEIVLHSFCSRANCTDGAEPRGSLIFDRQGNLYGTTGWAGEFSYCRPYGCGTVFELTRSGTETVLHSFGGVSTDGVYPVAGLVVGVNGNLFGTTEYGGNFSGCSNFGCGTVFEVTRSRTETVLYSFGANPNDGLEPAAGLVMDASGDLYGTTAEGGNSRSSCFSQDASGCGTVFKVTPSGQETVLYSFCPNGTPCTDGAGPGSLIFGADGSLYGTTAFGGNNYGTVFKVTPAGEETVLYIFSGGADGAYPFGGVIFDANGNLYGTTAGGGANGAGTVFELTPSGKVTVLHTFTGAPDGALSYAGLIMDKQGNLYGTTEYGGAHNVGTVFEVTPSGEGTVLYSFTGGPDGGFPEAGLVADESGNLYGTTMSGGVNEQGTVFELTQQVGSAMVSPTSLNFGNQVRYTTSNAQSVTLTNGGPHTLVISSITVTSNPERPGYFAISANRCGARLGVGQSCAVSVTFTPTKLGPLTGKLIFVENAPGSPQTVTLSGTGVVKIALTPRRFNFGKQKVGTTSNPETFTLTNDLSVALTGIAISTTGDFAVSATTCGTTLGGNQSCTISITFTPRAESLRAGELRVKDSARNSPQTAKLKGVGVGSMSAFPGRPVTLLFEQLVAFLTTSALSKD